MKRRARLANNGHALAGGYGRAEDRRLSSAPSQVRQRRPDALPAAHRYLEITYGEGKPLAAYLRFALGSGAIPAGSDDVGDGLSVDYDVDGNAIGIQLSVPGAVTSERLNRLLIALGQAPLCTEHGPRWLDEHVFPRWSVAVDYLI
jgi:hypothetical protein